MVRCMTCHFVLSEILNRGYSKVLMCSGQEARASLRNPPPFPGYSRTRRGQNEKHRTILRTPSPLPNPDLLRSQPAQNSMEGSNLRSANNLIPALVNAGILHIKTHAFTRLKT